ncbi:GSCOCG00009589001-RA-CDS [Cotesia congregata]|nr:GSCOCG00009589001-RA-CDS [Cotesia congregata]
MKYEFPQKKPLVNLPEASSAVKDLILSIRLTYITRYRENRVRRNYHNSRHI